MNFTNIHFTLPQGAIITRCTFPHDIDNGGYKIEDSVYRSALFKNIKPNHNVELVCLIAIPPTIIDLSDESIVDSFNVIAQYKYEARDTYTFTVKKEYEYEYILNLGEVCNLKSEDTGDLKVCKCKDGTEVPNGTGCEA